MIIYNLYRYMIVSSAVMNLYMYILKKKKGSHDISKFFFFLIFYDNL